MTDRKALYAKTSIALKDLKIDDDTFRDLLAQRYDGKRSRKDLSDTELVDLMDYFKEQGFKPKTTRGRGDGATNAKIRALWISLYELGVIENASERALTAFVKHQAKVDRLAWLPPDEAFKVIEALKTMAARPYEKGGAAVNWTEHENPRVCVARAQWRRLAAIGVVRIAANDGLDGWLQWKVAPHKTSFELIDDAQRDEAIRRLGSWLRRELDKLPKGAVS